MNRWIRISNKDNVVVALEALKPGEVIDGTALTEAVPAGHKVAIRFIPAGKAVIKYGFPIGRATQNIAAGKHVHTHNTATTLSESAEYEYTPSTLPVPPASGLEGATFMGYARADGRVGTRNEIWIINTVGCINRTSERLAQEANKRFSKRTDGIFNFAHPHGCSQLGDDHEATKEILLGLVKHPNAGGILVLGLGCENNSVSDFKEALGEFNSKRVKFLVTQEVEDEMEVGMALLEKLVEAAEGDRRTACPGSKLVVGMKCGASDGLSGTTANPLVGCFTDRVVAAGGTSILTEVPEMFGAETILMNRCRSREIFEKTVNLINDFKAYFKRYGQTVYENPSPGNKKGGISTLEDKSLGCIQKGGRATVEDVIPYGGRAAKPGLVLLNGPGNDIVSTTAMTAAGATLILFTTGRGTPLGAPVPTVKISSNSNLAMRKKNWIDFNAGAIAEGKAIDTICDTFCDDILDIASGKQTKNEINNYREIAIFKDGVTL
ncbi:MAG: altronate dehydratase family protein [Lentisphaeria bacterium]